MHPLDRNENMGFVVALIMSPFLHNQDEDENVGHLFPLLR